MINPERVYRVIKLAHETTKSGTENPRIAVCGINPHAGENGLLIGMQLAKAKSPSRRKIAASFNTFLLFLENCKYLSLSNRQTKIKPVILYLGQDYCT